MVFSVLFPLIFSRFCRSISYTTGYRILHSHQSPAAPYTPTWTNVHLAVVIATPGYVPRPTWAASPTAGTRGSRRVVRQCRGYLCSWPIGQQCCHTTTSCCERRSRRNILWFSTSSGRRAISATGRGTPKLAPSGRPMGARRKCWKCYSPRPYWSVAKPDLAVTFLPTVQSSPSIIRMPVAWSTTLTGLSGHLAVQIAIHRSARSSAMVRPMTVHCPCRSMVLSS